MSEQVIKPKNEGRVAAGKRLAEWNRKKKEDLLKNQSQVASSSSSSSDEVSSSSDEVSSCTLLNPSSVSIVLGGTVIAICVLLLWKRKTPVAQVKDTENDIFHMN